MTYGKITQKQLNTNRQNNTHKTTTEEEFSRETQEWKYFTLKQVHKSGFEINYRFFSYTLTGRLLQYHNFHLIRTHQTRQHHGSESDAYMKQFGQSTLRTHVDNVKDMKPTCVCVSVCVCVCVCQSWSCGSSVAFSLRVRWFWQCRTASSRWAAGGRRWTLCWWLLNIWATELDTRRVTLILTVHYWLISTWFAWSIYWSFCLNEIFRFRSSGQRTASDPEMFPVKWLKQVVTVSCLVPQVVTADVLADAHILILHTVSPAACLSLHMWVCLLQALQMFLSSCRVVTSPGAPAAEPSAGCPQRNPSRESRLRSAVWTWCWTSSLPRSQTQRQLISFTYHREKTYKGIYIYIFELHETNCWFSPTQVCPGSPPGVWVCSTDMILTIPADFGWCAVTECVRDDNNLFVHTVELSSDLFGQIYTAKKLDLLLLTDG